MNWIKRKILEWVFESEEYIDLINLVTDNFMYTLEKHTELYNLINKKHAHLEEQIQHLDSMLQMLASEAGLEFVVVEGEPEHLALKEIEYEEGDE